MSHALTDQEVTEMLTIARQFVKLSPPDEELDKLTAWCDRLEGDRNSLTQHEAEWFICLTAALANAAMSTHNAALASDARRLLELIDLFQAENPMKVDEDDPPSGADMIQAARDIVRRIQGS